MILWILSEAIIIALLEHMDAPTSIQFVSAAKFLWPYIKYVDHVKKLCVGESGISIITYSGKFLSLINARDRIHAGFAEFVKQQKLIIDRVSCGTKHIAAITSAGKLITWGDNSCGQCSVPDEYANNSEITFRKVKCHRNSTLAITNSGKLIIFGNGHELQKTIPNTSETFCKVSRNSINTAAITSSGRLVIWQNNTHRITDVCLSGREKFQKIYCFDEDIIAISNQGKINPFDNRYEELRNSQFLIGKRIRSISRGKITVAVTTENSWVMHGDCNSYFCDAHRFMSIYHKLRKIKCNHGCVTVLAFTGELLIDCNAVSFDNYENIPTRIRKLIANMKK